MAAVEELKSLLDGGCRVSKVQPAAFASDAEVNIVTVTCPDGRACTIKACREEAKEL